MVVKIDGIGITAEHFAAMSKPEAVKRMIADGFVPNNSEAWAEKAWDILNEKVNGPVAKPKVKKEKKESTE